MFLRVDGGTAEIVLDLKNKYPNIKLILILPCENQTKGWKEEDVIRYNYIRSKADKVKILSQNYFKGCMHLRNRYMVDCSSYCLCYCKRKIGGTFYTVSYAEKKGINIIHL